jgi:hypothetical protein
MPRLITVIETKLHVGTGTPEDPHRTVTHYFTPEGKWLATYDPVEYEETPSGPA